MSQTETAPTNKGEVQDLSALLNQKPEINSRVEYYKTLLKINDLLVSSIDNKLGEGTVTKKGKILGFIPFSLTKTLSNYDRGKLLQEKVELESQIYFQKKYFEDWLQRKNEYEVYFDKLSAECNERFDDIYASAKELALKNDRIATVVNRYKNPANDQEVKNSFYLFLRQEMKGKYAPKQQEV